MTFLPDDDLVEVATTGAFENDRLSAPIDDDELATLAEAATDPSDPSTGVV